MDWELIQGIVGVLGFLGLVVSVGLLIMQTRIAARATRAGVYQNVLVQMIDIDLFFIDHPELKPFFYNNMEISEEHPDYDRVLSVAEMLVDFIDGVFVLAPSMPEYPWHTWERYFRDLFASSPVLRKYWALYGDWYPETVKRAFDSV